MSAIKNHYHDKIEEESRTFIALDYEILLFNNQPNTIGIVVRGQEEPTVDPKMYIDFVKEITPVFTPEMDEKMIANPTVHIVINNDPQRPDDEFFIQYTFPFVITEAICDSFIAGAERFIKQLYQIQ